MTSPTGDTSELVSRLRSIANSTPSQEVDDASTEAADALTTLERELEEARRKAGKLHDYANMRDVHVSQLASFAKWAIQGAAFGGSELDGADVQEQALADCLIVRTVYDPDRHGPSDVAEPGDDWFEFSSTLSVKP